MKRLLLSRHSKASHANGFIPDFERNLNERGRNDAEIIAKILAERNICPGIIYTSPAVRTMETTAIFAEKLNYPLDQLKVIEFFYHNFTVREFFKFIYSQDQLLETILIIGHNPWISDLAARLCGDSYSHFPSSAVKSMLFNINSWKEISLGSGKLEFFEYPKLHKAGY